MLAPVVLFVYNRPEHTRKTVEALSRNPMAASTELFIFSDAPKNEKASNAVRQVRDYIRTLSDTKLFKSVTITEAPQNKGLANSIINGVSQVLEQHHQVIVLEDDLITAPGFLTYMNDALTFYENEPSVGSISAFTYPVKALKHYKHDVYFTGKGECWGWATWEDRWMPTDWDMKDYDTFMASPTQQRTFNKLQYDLTDMLADQYNGKINSWAVRWVYSLFRRQLLTVYPSETLVYNEGFDGSGTHCKAGINRYFDNPLELNAKKSFHFEILPANTRITRQVSIYEREKLSQKINRKAINFFNHRHHT